MQFIILCAGSGTRMEPFTPNISKPMLPVANSPALEWMLEKINGDVVIVANKSQKDLIEFAQSKDLKIAYQQRLKGTANALLAAEATAEDEFVVVNGDESFSEKDIKSIAKQKPYCIGICRVDNPENFGVWSAEGRVLKEIEEKPGSPKTNLANTGIYKADKGVFDYIRKTKPGKRKEMEITDAFNMMIKAGIRFIYHEAKSWKTLSHPWDMLRANREILDKKGSIIGKNVEIRPGAYIEEPVAIGDNTIAGPNCYIRKYSSIGKNCKVGNAVEIKNSIVMDNCHVSHLSYVGDSIIGRNCNIGAGTIFANLRLDEKPIKMNIRGQRTGTGMKKLGGFVGDNVKFGVNVTVMPGKKIWPNIMIPACMTIDDNLEKQPPLGGKKRRYAPICE